MDNTNRIVRMRGVSDRVAVAGPEPTITLLEAHTNILQALGLGIRELVDEAVENHKSEMLKRGRKPSDYDWVRSALEERIRNNTLDCHEWNL